MQFGKIKKKLELFSEFETGKQTVNQALTTYSIGVRIQDYTVNDEFFVFYVHPSDIKIAVSKGYVVTNETYLPIKQKTSLIIKTTLTPIIRQIRDNLRGIEHADIFFWRDAAHIGTFYDCYLLEFDYGCNTEVEAPDQLYQENDPVILYDRLYQENDPVTLYFDVASFNVIDDARDWICEEHLTPPHYTLNQT